MTTLAVRLAVELDAGFEGFRPWPYPDQGSQLYRATSRLRWGFVDPGPLLASLPAETRALSGAPWTIGYGSTGASITPNTPQWSRGVAMANLEARLESHVELIAQRAGRPLTAGQLAALASFLDNVGPGRAGVKDGLFVLRSGRASTLWSLVLAGRDAQAAGAFLSWVRAQGRVLPGLVRRRQAERALFLRGN